jgi:hypothetical protein
MYPLPGWKFSISNPLLFANFKLISTTRMKTGIFDEHLHAAIGQQLPIA